MRKCILGMLVLFGMTTQAQNQEVQQTIEIFFKGFHSRDSLAIQKVCSDKMGLQSIAENAKGSQFSTDTASKFYKSISSIFNTIQFEERLLGHTIHIDGIRMFYGYNHLHPSRERIREAHHQSGLCRPGPNRPAGRRGLLRKPQ